MSLRRSFDEDHQNETTNFVLPEIQSSFYNNRTAGNGMIHNYQGFPSKTFQSARDQYMYRLEDIDTRLGLQEKTIVTLQERAIKNKEDVIENLNMMQNTWQDEKRHREKIQESIKTITNFVKSLDNDLKYIAGELKAKEATINNASSSIKSFDYQQAVYLSEIRGRLARCDAVIAKLINDHSSFQETSKQSNNQQSETVKKLQEKIQSFESKLMDFSHRLERQATDSVMRSQTRDNDSTKDLVELKLRGNIEELRAVVNNARQQEELEREKAVSRLTQALERQEITTQEKLDKLERKLQSALNNISFELEGLKASFAGQDTQGVLEGMEKRLTRMVENTMKQQNDQIMKIKGECREGFATVHESLNNSKVLLEGKISLAEEQLKKEMLHIKKMVVLI